MKYKFLLLCLLACTITASEARQTGYFPGKHNWERREAGENGFSTGKLKEAIDFAKANEYSGEKDLQLAIIKGFSHEPFHKLLGPVKERGGPAGVILKNGYIVAEWGDTRRVDMTFSVTKSYLSTIAGLALHNGLIQTVDDKVETYVWDGKFAGRHNSQITWRHLLNQSSDWSGTLFGIHDWADRPPREGDLDDWKNRKYHEPGTHFKYNDVRVNLLAFSLLQVWRKPLPVVLREEIMDKIDASPTWRWYGYDHAWVTVDGLKMQSVTGGGHSGAGLFINTLDHARFGLLFENDGRWKDRQIISPEWIKMATESSVANERYGFMWWLNRGNAKWANFSEDVFYAAGFGGNFIIIDPSRDLVVVTRWLEPSKLGEFMDLVGKSLK